MNDSKVFRWTGTFGVAGFVVFLAALPLYYLGGQEPPIQDTARTSEFVTRTATLIIARATIADPLIMGCMLVFLAGFRHLVKQSQPKYEWISTLVFGSGLVVITLELVGDALQGAAALDALAKPESAVIRGLLEGSFPFYGAVGLIMSAFFLASASYATLVAGVLPKWTGWFAFAAALANLTAAPSIFLAPDYTRFYSATGFATMIGQGLLVLWFLIAGVAMITLKREPVAFTDESLAHN
jgi:hypothetical protein